MDFSRFYRPADLCRGAVDPDFVAGAIAIPLLPISEYPDVVPPSVQVRAEYPGPTRKRSLKRWQRRWKKRSTASKT